MIYARPDHGLVRDIGYEIRGEGPAVIFLHPFPFDRRFWDVTRAALPDHRTVAIDARGFGDSAIGEAGFSIDDLADDVVALLDHLGIVMAAVVGCSMGGYVALSMAARHPARISALVLSDTRAGADGDAARANRGAAIAEIKAHGPSAYLDGVAVRLCGRSVSDELRASVQALAESASREEARALMVTLAALRDRPDRTTALGELRVPALVIVGREDTVTPPDEARAMNDAIRGAELVEIDAAGHLPAREQPAAFDAALSAFLRAHL